jgi:hypothetical protein
VAKNANLANWSWKGHVTKAIIQKNLQDEKKRIDEQDQSWPGGAK